MFIWVTLPEGVSADRSAGGFAPARRGVRAGPIVLSRTGRSSNTLRLNFTHADDAAMDRGMSILAEEVRRLTG